MTWRIEINRDNTQATLDLRKHSSSESLDVQSLINALKDQHVPITDQVWQKVKAALENLRGAKSLVILQSTPPQAGQDAYFQWADNFDPEKRHAEVAALSEAERSSFYERSNLIIASTGDVLGVLHPATSGRAGQDIFGRVIEPAPGKELELNAGENVQGRLDGVFIAQCAGEPQLSNGVLSIDPILHIKTDVDFSTGNVRFGGDIEIKGDIKDLFTVQAGGNLQVGGTIEAATVECGGSLQVARGILGKEKGMIKVQKDLSAKFLSNVDVWVEGDITIDTQIVNANLNCRGNLRLKRGAIHGGQITAAGSIETPMLGSQTGTRTVIRSGVDPYLDRQINELKVEKAQHEKKIVELMPRAKNLLYVCQGKPNEQLKKMAEEIRQCKTRIEALSTLLEGLEAQYTDNCKGLIIILKTIYPGTEIFIGKTRQIVNVEITGPLEIVSPNPKDPAATLIFRTPENIGNYA